MEDTFRVRPSVCFEVQKITGLSIGKGNLRNYQVQWAPTWISGIHLVGCEHLIEEFIHWQSEKDQLMNDTDAITDTDDDLREDVLVDHNVSDSTYRDEFSGAHKRASMVVNDDRLFENVQANSCSYSNSINENENVEVISIETNELKEGICTSDKYGNNQTNPNFEWVERSVEDTCNEEDTNKNESLSLIYSNPLGDNDNTTNRDDNTTNTNRVGDPAFTDGQHAKPLLHFSKAFINTEKPESNDEFQNNVLEVKTEEIILIEGPENDHTHLNEDYENRLKSLNKPASKYECSACHKLFKNKSGLTSHFINTHGSENTFDCDVCERKCKSKTYLLKHKLTHVTEKQYKCNVCSKVFSENSNLQAHLRTHTEQRSHQCSFCEKVFFTSTELKRHTRVHTGERPFQCKICKKTFKRNDHLQKHTRTHRETT